MIRIIHNAFGSLLDWLGYWLSWENIKAFSNSNFFTALIGSMAGAYFGAKAAQKIAERAKLREDLLSEIRSTNLALSLAWGIVNSALNFKSQLVKPLYDGYQEKLSKYTSDREIREKTGDPAKRVVVFQPDLSVLQIPEVPALELQSVCAERLSMDGRGINLALQIHQSLKQLTGILVYRNELIESAKTSNMPAHIFAAWYFGVPYQTNEGTQVHQEYLHSVTAIYENTDDVIFFGWLLCKDIHAHGLLLIERYKKIIKKFDIGIKEPLFDDAERKGLIPNHEKYADWVNWGKKSAEAQTA